jgi:biofilm protein TabA
MILDSLNNNQAYISLHPLFKKAFDYIQVNDLLTAEPGKIELEPDKLYLSVMEISGKTPEGAKMEAHKRFIDIQIVLKGTETMGWASLANCSNEVTPYSSDKDIVFYSDKPTTYITVQPGEFVVFFPTDVHAPAIGNGLIKKVVIKVFV